MERRRYLNAVTILAALLGGCDSGSGPGPTMPPSTLPAPIDCDDPELETVVLSPAQFSQIEGCRALAGGLRIELRKDLKGLAPLPKLRSIGGDLDIVSTDLTSLDLFPNLASIGGRMMLHECDALNDLSGLKSLTSVGGLVVYGSDQLVDLHGLEAVTQIDGEITIAFNDGLQSLAGLDGLSMAGANLTIRDNNHLTSLAALSSLARVEGVLSTGDLSRFSNFELASLDGLGALQYVGGLLVHATSLTTLAGLAGLKTIGPDGLVVEKNYFLASLDGLSALSVVEGDFKVVYNSELLQCDVDRLAARLAKPTGQDPCQDESERNQRPRIHALSSL